MSEKALLMVGMVRSCAILMVAALLLLGDVFKVALVAGIDPFLKYFFGGISFLYGSFRVYRSIFDYRTQGRYREQ